MADKKQQNITDEKAFQIYLRGYTMRNTNVSSDFIDSTFGMLDGMEAQAAFTLGVQDAVQEEMVDTFVEFSQRIHDFLSLDTVD